MPQLVKGGKWTFGWIETSRDGQCPIPPEAWIEYRFKSTNAFIATPASRSSGGFGVTTRHRIKASLPIKPLASLSVVAEGVLQLPEILFELTGLPRGVRLLAVRGNRFALGCIAKGRIIQEAFNHPDLDVFTTKSVTSHFIRLSEEKQD